MDARNTAFYSRSLRGGTRTHSWSGDGKWISFTYNDYIMERLVAADSGVKDLRTIANDAPKVTVPDDGTMENNSGECFSAVVAGLRKIRPGQ